MDVAERIIKEMELKGVKQKDFVEYLNEKQSAVSKWIGPNPANRNNIPNTILGKMAKYLKVDTDYLLGLQEEKNRVGTVVTDDLRQKITLEEIQKDPEKYLEIIKISMEQMELDKKLLALLKEARES